LGYFGKRVPEARTKRDGQHGVIAITKGPGKFDQNVSCVGIWAVLGVGLSLFDRLGLGPSGCKQTL